jgi:hypothetical protein
MEVPNRYLAGVTEVALKNHYADKTTGVKCWLNSIEHVDLLAERLKLENLIPSEVQEYFFWIKMICMKCITRFCNTQQKSLSLWKDT